MIIYQKTGGCWPADHPDREVASASATGRRDLLHSACMMAQGGETLDGKEPVQVSPPRSRPQGAPNRRGDVPQATVLILDDEKCVRETLVEVLSIHGYGVITAASVGEAEEAKQQLDVEGIHLVITDIHLTPSRQLRAGYALAQRWRMAQPGLPIILISGDLRNQDLPEVRDGSLRFLLKPFRMEVFIKAVQEALGR